MRFENSTLFLQRARLWKRALFVSFYDVRIVVDVYCEWLLGDNFFSKHFVSCYCYICNVFSALVDEIVVQTINGFHQLSVPLVSRRGSCRFTLQPYTNTLGDFYKSILDEDKAIQQVHAENEGNLLCCLQLSLWPLSVCAFLFSVVVTYLLDLVPWRRWQGPRILAAHTANSVSNNVCRKRADMPQVLISRLPHSLPECCLAISFWVSLLVVFLVDGHEAVCKEDNLCSYVKYDQSMTVCASVINWWYPAL